MGMNKEFVIDADKWMGCWLCCEKCESGGCLPMKKNNKPICCELMERLQWELGDSNRGAVEIKVDGEVSLAK